MSEKKNFPLPISNSFEQNLEEDFDLIIENILPDNFVTENSYPKNSILNKCSSPSSSSSSDWEISLDTQIPLKDSQTDEKEWSKDTDETDRLQMLRKRHIKYESDKNYDYENELFGDSFFSELSTEKSVEDSTLLLNNSIDSNNTKKINFFNDLRNINKRLHSPEQNIKMVDKKRHKRSYSYSPNYFYNKN